MTKTAPASIPLPPLSVSGALTLGTHLLSAGEPIEERPAFLAHTLLRLDDAVRELRGAVQYRSQVRVAHPSRQQRMRAEVNVYSAHEAVVSAIRSYVLRVAVIVDELHPETVSLARALIEPMVAFELRHVEQANPRRAAHRTAA